MADEEQEGGVRHVGENVQLNGRPFRRTDTLAPGTLTVNHVYRKEDGTEFAAPMQFRLGDDLFREELQIVIKNVPDGMAMEVGQPFIVEFDVVSGSADSFMPLFSSEGDAEDKFGFFLDRPLTGNLRRFPFTAPDIESADCYLIVGGYKTDGSPVGFSDKAGPFAIRKPTVRDEVIIAAIKTPVTVGERVPVSFEVKTSKTINRFDVSYFSTSKNIPYTPLLSGALAGGLRQFTFDAPDVEADDVVIVIVPYDQMTENPMQFGKSNPIKITKTAVEEDLTLSPVKNPLMQGEELTVPFTFNERGPFDGFLVYLESTRPKWVRELFRPLPANERAVPFTVPEDLLSDRCVLTIAVYRAGAEVRRAKSNEFRIIVKEERDGGGGPGTDDLDGIQQALGTLKIPAKTGFWVKEEVSIGTFLYNLITTEEVGKYFTTYNRLRNIAPLLQSEQVHARLGDALYGEFFSRLERLESLRRQIEGLEDARALRARVKELFKAFTSRGKDMREMSADLDRALLEDFRRVFKSDVEHLNADIIVRNIHHLSWFVEHDSEIDQVLERYGRGFFKMTDLRAFLKSILVPTREFWDELQAMRKTIQAIKKKLATTR